MPLRKTTFSTEAERRACKLVEQGFSRKMVQRETGLSPSVIGYRCKLTGTKARDYRDGISKLSMLVSSRLDRMAERVVAEKIRKLMEIHPKT